MYLIVLPAHFTKFKRNFNFEEQTNTMDDSELAGILGTSLYVVTLFLAIIALWLTASCASTKAYYLSLLLMSTFEIPHFLVVVITRGGDMKAVYCLHIFAGSLYFTSFALVCNQWGKLLKIDVNPDRKYEQGALIFMNSSFMLVDVVAVGICIEMPTLDNFRNSFSYTILLVIEGFKNIVFAVLLSWYGFRLIGRLWNYSEDELYHTSFVGAVWHGLFPARRFREMEDDAIEDHNNFEFQSINTQERRRPEALFLGVSIRIAYVLFIATTCFALRVTMVTLEIVMIESSKRGAAHESFRSDMLWVLLVDLIPRVVPSLSFMQLMSKRHTPSRISSHCEDAVPYDVTYELDSEQSVPLSEN